MALSLVYAWLTMFRPKGDARQRESERGVTFCCSWVEAHWIAPTELQTPPKAHAGGKEYVCTPTPEHHLLPHC